jgi:hypothetical protein
MRVGATRSALIGSLQLPLVPLRVWLAFGEVPSRAAVIGDIRTARPKD